MSLAAYLSSFAPPVDASVLADANDRLRDAEFWPAFLLNTQSSETAVEAFGVDPADVEEYAEALVQDENVWPVITVELAQGHTLLILFRVFPDDAGIDYLIQPKGSDEMIALAQLDGHFCGPGLRWSEVLSAAAQVSTLSRAERLLLLLPALGDDELPADAEDVVAAALGEVGVVQVEDCLTIAQEILEAPDWGAQPWGEWKGLTVCFGSHSLRSTDTPPERLALFSEALA
ncbi:hypothetical protein [Kineosporia babensis]|uniref:Uncharacterized protein n=1 Tax=Kineosporia babensis TaxID=499548 RepID=A0A9X1SU99_9ACTN|nr:hypothetical protein [Kineosporia babensis]MCD5312732.1 hypothetical protein [Kineosporia babensis]